MNMPLMNGLEFITKAKLTHEDISYLLLTGYTVNQDSEKALNEGLIYKCMFKPFDREGIIATVKELTN